MMFLNINIRLLRMVNIVSMFRNNVIIFFLVIREIVLYLCDVCFVLVFELVIGKVIVLRRNKEFVEEVFFG